MHQSIEVSSLFLDTKDLLPFYGNPPWPVSLASKLHLICYWSRSFFCQIKEAGSVSEIFSMINKELLKNPLYKMAGF
jgi:hypothetical protein